ncbi:MAG: cupin domain-containing protein [Betaproteobacteria bacterium]|nr:cupin domain-containing protein [Betaproteobacteria bacterium]
MNVTRIDSAPVYEAPNHFAMRCLRLQGHEAGPSQSLWLGLSIIEPGGYTSLNASPLEKHYVVLEGELTLVSELDGVTTEAVLHPQDSACFQPGEKRQLINRSAGPARILLAMPYPPTP